MAAVLAGAMTAPASAQIHRSPPPPGATSHTIVPGERYRAGGLTRFLLGDDYRDLWTAEIGAPVLNLDSVGGGLTPTRTGGFGQSVSLHFDGNDGRRYVVRSIDKDPTKRLLPALKGTFVEGIVQDQISALHPSAALVVDPLLDATGILHASHRMVIIPDDPRLGEFREEFAGMLGMLVLHPDDGADGTAGFAGSERINGSETFFDRLERNPCDRVNAPAFLKARLMDFLIGDKDRHQGQWRWAAFPEGECRRWEPIPEDRDQAFIDFDGFIMWLAKIGRPQQIPFGADYPSVKGLTFNGWEVDRELLSELPWPVWDSLVGVVQVELTDAVIDAALRRMPPPHYARTAERIGRALRQRRDHLSEFAHAYYDLITDRVEIKGTDEDERAEFTHLDNGDLDVAITLLDDDDNAYTGRPYFHRVFKAEETTEVRMYLRGGDDSTVVRGGSGQVTIRVDGGGGDDVFTNVSRTGAGKTRFYDARGDNHFARGTGAKVNEDDYDRPPSADQAHKFALDWGHVWLSLPLISYSPDLGLTVGGYSQLERYGFRRDPYHDRHTLTATLATGIMEPLIKYRGRWRSLLPRLDGIIAFEWSGHDVIHFYGFGNETERTAPSSFFSVSRRHVQLEPGFRLHLGDGVELEFGPTFTYSDASRSRNVGMFIDTEAPDGYDTYNQLGVRTHLEIDTRDNSGAARSGAYVNVTGTVHPEIMDVSSTFGAIEGSAATYLSAGGPFAPTLALRVGGRKVWGDYPFHEAAYIGGTRNVRGFREQRFAGDAGAFGNAELRIDLLPLNILVPGRLGLFGATDAGRVWFDGDPADADTWHTAVGGGIWLSFVDRIQSMSIGLMRGDEFTGLYIQAGFHY